jgi:hypothetical protein
MMPELPELLELPELPELPELLELSELLESLSLPPNTALRRPNTIAMIINHISSSF